MGIVRRLLAATLCLPALAWAADPQIASFVDDTDPVPAGSSFTYTIRVDNNAVDAAINTRLRLSVPSGATFLSATPANQNCTPTTPTQIDCNLGTLGANGSDVRLIVMSWRANGPGGTALTATATVTADNDSNPANNTQNQTTTVNDGANLGLVMSDAPDPVVGGSNVSYTLTASNAGPSATGNIVITSNLSPSTTYESFSGSGWSCTHAAGVVTCNRSGPIAAGAAIPLLNIVARVDTAGGTVTHSATLAPAAGGVVDPDASDNTAAVSTSVLPGADVRIQQKSVTSATPAVAGSNVSFRIQPRNGGPGAASSVTVSDTLPAGWSFVSASGSNWSCSAAGQTVSCTRATMPASATDDIDIVATAPGNGVVAPGGSSYTNTATISSTTADPNSGNNSGSVNVSVLRDGADLRIDKFKTPDPVAQGSPLTSTITVTNNGPRTATGPLRVVEVLTGESYVSASGTGWSCTPSANVVVCNHANAGGLAVNASLPDLLIVSTAVAAGTVTNTACTGSSVPAGVVGFPASPPLEGDPNPGNDCATSNASSTTVQPDLAISVSTSTPSGGDKTVSTTESSVTYTLVVSNASLAAQGATGVRITDTVPGFISGRTTINALVPVVSGGSSATFSCSAAGAAITCNQTGGTLAQGETVTVPVTMNRPLLEGSFSNTAYVTNTVQGDPNGTNNSASDTVVIEAIADVEMTGKTVTPGAIRAGETATYVLSFRNNGPSQAQAVTLTDTLSFAPGDAGLTVVSITSSKAGSSCSIAAGAQLTPASSSFSCSIGAMANNESQTVTLVVRPNFQAGNPARSVGNVASLTTTSVENPAGGDNGNNSRNATLNITAASIDLLVNTTDAIDPVPYLAGNTFLDYRVRITNNGPSYGTGVLATETATPPAGRRIRFVCDTTAFGSATCNASSLCSATNQTSGSGTPLAPFTCSVPAGSATTGPAQGELAVGQSKDIFLRFEVLDVPNATGDVFNVSSTVSANEPDGFSANNTEGEATTTRQRIDMRVSKAASLPTVTLRQPFQWTITVTNNGPGNSLQTDLSDTLPAGTEVTGPITWTRTLQPGSGSCTLAGQTVSCALGQLDGGGSAVVTVPVRFISYPAGGVASNSATVDTSPARTGAIDTPGGFNTGNATVTVTRSSISGTVFEDRDRAGANAGTPQAPGTEPRLAGVSLRLTGTDAYGNAVDLSTSTDSNGSYSFTSLAPANGSGYALTQTQPATHINGPADVPTAGGQQPSAGGSYARGGLGGSSVYSAIPLGAATDAVNYHFPELRRVALSGFVYIDLDGNNSRDAGSDPAIAGATVRLLDAGSLALIAQTSTDSNGAWSFANLDPLTVYTLEQPLPAAPAGLVNGSAQAGLIGGAACASGCTVQPDSPAAGTDRIAGIDLSSYQDGTLFNFGERQVALVSGTVYLDRNRNSSWDGAPTDAPLPGVTLGVYAGSSCAGAPLATTLSDSSGGYAFAGLTVGLPYSVCQTQPAAWADGGVNPGTAGSSSAANRISLSALPPGGSAGNHFGERAASLAGAVYLDANHDGQRQGGEPPLAGVTVQLSGLDITGTALSRSTVTEAGGNFAFDDLPAAGAGGYALTQQVAQPLHAGVTTLNGRTTAGTLAGIPLGTATSVATVPSAIQSIALPAGGQSTGHLFGEILPVAVRGSVFIDLNNNGAADGPGDAGLAGVSIVLSGTDDTGAAVNRSLPSAADGSFAFDNLRPGTYTLTEPGQPAATSNGLTVPGTAGGTATPVATLPSAIAGIVLSTPGSLSLDNRFAEIANSSALSGRVWLDADNDGTVGATESGIAAQTIELSGVDSGGTALTRSVQTDADGRFAFTALPPGVYSLRQPSQPAGSLSGRTLAGTGGGTATAPGLTPSLISGITLAVGQSLTDNLFGEIPPARVSGRVFADHNDNARADAGEPGLGGVTVQLGGTDDLGQTVTRTLSTAADGSFSFADLRPGNYTLTEPLQPAGTVNGQTVAGTLGGTATAVGVTPSAIAGIVLPVGALSQDNLFGELADSPDLRVSKRHEGSVFTVGKTASYRLVVRNVGPQASAGSYTVEDRLPPGLTLVATPTGAGWSCTGAAGAGSFSCSASAVLAPGAASAEITALAMVAEAAAAASPVHNAVLVDGGGEIEARRPSAAQRNAFLNQPQTLPLCTPAIEHEACRDPAPVQRAASLSGTVWFDHGATPRVLDAGDRRLAGWTVQIVEVATGSVVASTVTGTDGRYRVAELIPGIEYGVRFRDPASQVVFGYPVNGETAPGSSGASCASGTAPAGAASSCVATHGTTPQLSVVLAPGAELTQQSLPIDPSGVVYDSGTRAPLAGSQVRLAPEGSCPGWNPATSLVGATLGGYVLDASSATMTVGADGFYQFLFAPAAPASCSFALSVVPPQGYTFSSAAIPPEPGVLQPPGGTGSTYLVQPQATAPTGPVGPATVYHLRVLSGSAGANIIHNHIPLDPELPGGLSLSKQGDKLQAQIGDTVRYTVTVTLRSGARPRQTTVVDRLPAGFTYIAGTATVNDQRIADPAGGLGPTLAFQLGAMPPGNQLVLRYRLRVGVGAAEGDGINRALAHACGAPGGCVDAAFAPRPGSVATNSAQHRVQVSGGVFGGEACVLGKVFVDCNHNHVQDREELGIPGVRLMLSDLTFLITDSEGKYSVCGLPPRSHAIRIDPATLPRGARLSTSSNRNLGDAGSLWLDLKSGELHRADFIEGSCSNTVLEQVKARRAQGEVRAPEVERQGSPALRFDNKAHGLDTRRSPQQGTDGANQRAPKPRPTAPAPGGAGRDESHVPTPELPMNTPPPRGRDPGQAPDAAAHDAPTGGRHGSR
ncbi:MAG: DUF11 domain-containing protein [Rubrivivax sp.]|nr:DUF11 domain-containing protein [Rubrivivax sp.]